ncbi:ATP-binding protein [Aliidiomarina celeris]|uniref:ATP-binding protein n=1 Tax=Aliidiomarina celeris TaxID=2249428 RepID=UPI000DEC0001|nr:ATP-binding protein [Aliidiomarina celeris]
MAQLLKIIMINGHLPGVVELDLNGHTNICGSNASGKTTLQRMIPVFYGELPNRVVPRTRQNFDKYYLPHKNSYVIYEYQRPSGENAHVVLTKRADGVDYRFVDGAYAPELYLHEKNGKAIAVEYAEWATRLKTAGLASSHKISSTSEYRGIILNDLKMDRSQRREVLKAKQLVSRYALAGDGMRLRHIEKLVSAVHAKEGKMDTLKSMLAAILEEDGHDRPDNSITRSKINAWLQDMQQYLKLDKLQTQFAKVEQQANERQHNLTALWQLKPLVEADHQALMTQKADDDAALQQLTKVIQQRENDYDSQRRSLKDQLQNAEVELKSVQKQIEDAQKRYDTFADEDMDGLARKLEALPDMRTELLELTQQYQLFMEEHGEAERQLKAHQLSLEQNLNQLIEKTQKKTKEKERQHRELLAQQSDAIEELRQQLQHKVQQLSDRYGERIDAVQQQLTRQQTQLSLSGVTEEEQEAAKLADLRLDAAQAQVNKEARARELAQKQVEQQKRTRDQADEALTAARQQEVAAQQEVQRVQLQLSPVPGSLRQFLRDHIDGWETNLGKVLAEDLLQRTDLLPQYTGSSDSLFGLQLDLTAITLPEHAQSEAELQARLTTVKAQWHDKTSARELAEKALAKAVAQVKHAELEWQEADQRYRQRQNDVDFARDAKLRLAEEQQKQLRERKTALRAGIAERETELERFKKERETALQALRNDVREQEMELKADFQDQLHQLEDAIEALNNEVQRRREQNKARYKELEQQFNDELAAKGVDQKRLQALKAEMEALDNEIRAIDSQRDRLSEYQQFMRVVWQQERPQWLQQEQHDKQQVRETSAELEQLERDYKAAQKADRAQQNQYKEQIQRADNQLKDTIELLRRLNGLSAPSVAPSDERLNAGTAGDVIERIARCHQLFDEQAKLEKSIEVELGDLERELRSGANPKFAEFIDQGFANVTDKEDLQARVAAIHEMILILEGQQQQVVYQGHTIGNALDNFFSVFNDIHKRVGEYSRRLTAAVTDELTLDGIDHSEVKISSTIDELGFWQPLKQTIEHYRQWTASGQLLPPPEYLDYLRDVGELLKADQEYSIESLLKLQLNIVEQGAALVIKNDRQLAESSSHGMAYLILCKFLLAFTRLLRPENANVVIHWPIDEIGTLAYHNVEKLFEACNSNQIHIVGAFPNPESDVLLLFKNRYLIEPSQAHPGKGQLKRIKPRVSALAEKLAEKVQEETPA